MYMSENSFVRVLGYSIIVWLLVQCTQSKEKAKGPVVRQYTVVAINFDTLAYREKVYVPTYTEIYSNAEDQYFPLFTSLSVRNTSLSESMYVRAVDYYNTEGTRLKSYLTQPIILKPLQSVEFPVRRGDEGGAGANFIVDWGSATTGLKPVLQAVMIGSAYQQGISFVTEGVAVETSAGLPVSK